MAPELPHGGSGAFLCPFSAPSLYCSLLSFGLFALSGTACLLSSAPPCSPRECPCRTGPLYVPSWVPSFCPPPDSRLPSVAPGCGTAYSLLDSSLLPVLLSSAPPRSPRVCPGRVGPPVCPAMGTLLLLFPDSRFPSVVPGCGAAYSLLGSSLLPALSAYSLKPLLALPGCAPAGRAPCMPPAFSRFQAPGRDTRPRPVPASLSSPLRARAPVSSFFAVQCAKCCISNFLVLILRKN